MDYHVPVMLNECLDALAIAEAGVYVDATFGGGGHSRGILARLGPQGRLLGIDRDADAAANAPADPRFKLLHGDFRYLSKLLRLEGVAQVDGILADLGVSSHQLDEAERGFSFRFEAELDMRMNQVGEVTAASVLNGHDAEALQRILGEYGEVRNARTLAQALVAQRQIRPFERIGDLLEVLDKHVRGKRNRYLAQVFQALRIEVNDEMGALGAFLGEALSVLKPGGRLAIMTYHSLEDRPVKNFLRTGNVEGEADKDFYGRIHRPFELLTRKPILPQAAEIEQNPRARSAKLRVAAKIG